MDIIDTVSLVSQISGSDIIKYGAVASSIIAIATLGRQVWSFFLKFSTALWRVFYILILIPSCYILVWSIEGLVALFGVTREVLARQPSFDDQDG